VNCSERCFRAKYFCITAVGIKLLNVAFGSGGVSDSPKQNVSSKLFAVVGISLSNHAMWCYLQVMWGFNVSQATHCPHAERARRSLPSHGPPTHKPVVSSLTISTVCGAVPI
jgi:hypothetical protein